MDWEKSSGEAWTHLQSQLRVLWFPGVKGVPCVHFSIFHPEQKLFIERLHSSLSHTETPPSSHLVDQDPKHTDMCTTSHQHINTRTDTHMHVHTHILRSTLERKLHYTGITTRNVLIKCYRQLQNARRENGNDLVHQA